MLYMFHCFALCHGLLLGRQRLLDRYRRLDELFQHTVQLGEIVFALLHFCDEHLLLLQFLLATLLQFDADLVFVLDACGHDHVFRGPFMLWENL